MPTRDRRFKSLQKTAESCMKLTDMYSIPVNKIVIFTLYTVDATEYVTAQIDATFHEGREKRRTVS